MSESSGLTIVAKGRLDVSREKDDCPPKKPELPLVTIVDIFPIGVENLPRGDPWTPEISVVESRFPSADLLRASASVLLSMFSNLTPSDTILSLHQC